MTAGLDAILLERGIISPADVARARDIQRSFGGQLGEILIRIGAVGEEEVLAARSRQFGVAIFAPEEAPADLAELTLAMEPLAPKLRRSVEP